MHPTRSESELLRKVDDYYSTRLRIFGAVPLGVDWRGPDSQRLRFDVLLQAIRAPAAFSLIDYGCGYGALAEHLGQRGIRNCEYIGYDISASMLEAARGRPRPLPSCRFVNGDEPLPKVDYCLASGIFNVRLGTEPDVWFEYMTHVWEEMNEVSRVAFGFNCLSTSSHTDGRTDQLYYADPARVLDYCTRRYSPWVALLHDYPLHEFTVVVRKAGSRSG